MVSIRPFRGLLPPPDLAAQVAAPPYDVLSSDEARDQCQGNPRSFLRVNKPEVDFPAGVSLYDQSVYDQGKRNLEMFVSNGTLARDTSPCFYLIRMTMRGRSQTGLVALTSVDEYNRGIIKKHEHTRPEKVTDRARHIETLSAQVGPVMSAFRSTPEIERLFSEVQATEPAIDIVSEYDVRHELWRIADAARIEKLTTLFGNLDALYIADGHHRSEAASYTARARENGFSVRDGSFAWFLNVLFPDSQLAILPYNRVVKDLQGMTMDQLLKKVRINFTVEASPTPVDPEIQHTFGMYTGGAWYRLEARTGSFDPQHPSQSLDSDILTRNLLTPVLGIGNLRTDTRIDFVGGIRGLNELVRLVDSGSHAVAFSLHPVSIRQLFAIADAGDVMPPKSTWFEPKLRDGLVTHLIDE